MLSLSDNILADCSESSGFQTASARLAKVALMTALSSLHIVSTVHIIAFYQLTAVLSPQTRRRELVLSTSADACLCQPRRARAFLAPRSGRRGRASSAFRRRHLHFASVSATRRASPSAYPTSCGSTSRLACPAQVPQIPRIGLSRAGDAWGAWGRRC